MVDFMTKGGLIGFLLLAGGFFSCIPAQEPDGDAWYYERIAVQERPLSDLDEVPESWQDGWNPFVRRLREKVASGLERERELPRLRFELQGDRSNKFALFRCLESEVGYSLIWEVDEAVPVQDIFLLPTRIPQADGTIRTLGFPLQSRIEISATGDFDADSRVFEVPSAESGGPAGFPIRVALDGLPCRTIRWVIEKPYAPFTIGYLAVSEIFILSGDTNIAPEGRLRWSDSFLPDRSMAPGFLKDEKTPLGLPLIREETSVLGYHSEIKEAAEVDEEWIELTWDRPQEIASIRLIPAQQRVLPHTETFGFPLAHRTDFFLRGEKLGSRSVRYAIDPGQNVVTVPGFAGQEVDRVRWVATELWQRRSSRFLALAEIEAFGGKGENLAAKAKLAVSSDGIENRIWNLESLTDGLASEGRLISSGEWLRGLDEARLVRKERLAYTDRLRRVIRLTNEILFLTIIVALTLVAIGFAVSWWRERRRAEAESSRFRKQLASDLHDDLGGNLGSIVLLADQVRENGRNNRDASDDLLRVVELARESRNQLRTILEVSDDRRGLSLDEDAFVSRLRFSVQDFFGEDHGYLTIPDDGGKTIARLSGKQRREILLFCKESLHNLSQHSDATRVLVQLEASRDVILFKIEDDSSIPITENGILLSNSLQRRGQRLATRVEVELRDDGNSLILEIETAPL